jgi:hypothetical protein
MTAKDFGLEKFFSSASKTVGVVLLNEEVDING